MHCLKLTAMESQSIVSCTTLSRKSSSLNGDVGEVQIVTDFAANYELREVTMIEIDVRGFSCPIPVVKTKKAIEEHPGEPITVMVETEVSKENVTRLANSKGYSVTLEKAAGDEYHLQLIPSK